MKTKLTLLILMYLLIISSCTNPSKPAQTVDLGGRWLIQTNVDEYISIIRVEGFSYLTMDDIEFAGIFRDDYRTFDGNSEVTDDVNIHLYLKMSSDTTLYGYYKVISSNQTTRHYLKGLRR